MTIKGADGNDYNVASQGLGGTALGLGIGGLALSLLNGGNLLNSQSSASSSTPQWVSKEEFEQQQKISTLEMQNAILTANAQTDAKLVEVYKASAERDNKYSSALESQYRELDAKITAERESRLVAEGQQGVLNSQFTTGIAMLNGQVTNMQSVLNDITTSVIPSNKVCDTGCGCSNN